jgi:hypothetical protein
LMDVAAAEDERAKAELTMWTVKADRTTINLKPGLPVDISQLVGKKVTVEATVVVRNPVNNSKRHTVTLYTYSGIATPESSSVMPNGLIKDGDSEQKNSVTLSPGQADSVEVEKDYRLSGKSFDHTFVLIVMDQADWPPNVLKMDVVGRVAGP